MQAQGGAGALIRCPMNLSSFSGTGGPKRLPVPVSPGLSFPIDDISGLGLVPEVVLPAECTVKTLLCQSTVISDRSHEAFTVLKYTSFHQLPWTSWDISHGESLRVPKGWICVLEGPTATLLAKVFGFSAHLPVES